MSHTVLRSSLEDTCTVRYQAFCTVLDFPNRERQNARNFDSHLTANATIGPNRTQTDEMPKRKRGKEPSFSERLSKLEDDVFRALKTAKGFERQRLSKRARDAGVTDEKRQRLDREIAVLKVCSA